VPAAIDDEARRQFAALGVPLDQMPPAVPVAATHVEVWPCHWAALRVFLGCKTQWRCSAGWADLIWHGLDYASVEIVERRLGVTVDLSDITTMELAARAVLNGGDE